MSIDDQDQRSEVEAEAGADTAEAARQADAAGAECPGGPTALT